MSEDVMLLVLAAAVLAGGYKIWQTSLDAREAANRIAKDTCSRAVVQFLDGTVAFAGFRLSSGTQGGRRLLRTYTFDYTNDGFERAQGFIVLAGRRLEAVGLAGRPSWIKTPPTIFARTPTAPMAPPLRRSLCNARPPQVWAVLGPPTPPP